MDIGTWMLSKINFIKNYIRKFDYCVTIIQNFVTSLEFATKSEMYKTFKPIILSILPVN